MKLFDITGLPIECKYPDIEHWGIKGQKWGVRRYQNPDGSLTDLGKKRYLRNGELTKKGKNKIDANKLNKYQTKMKNAKAIKDAVPDVEIRTIKNPHGDDFLSVEIKRTVGKSSIRITPNGLDGPELDINGIVDASKNPEKYRNAMRNAMRERINDKSGDTKKFLEYFNKGKTVDEILDSLDNEYYIYINGPWSIMGTTGEATGWHDWYFEFDPKTMKFGRDSFDG